MPFEQTKVQEPLIKMIKDLEAETLSMGERERNLSQVVNQKQMLIAELKANQPKPDLREFVNK